MVTMLTRPTLVLYRVWQPVGVAPVARALTLVVADRARIVDPASFQQYSWSDWARLIPGADELCLRSVTACVRLPEVITLNVTAGTPYFFFIDSYTDAATDEFAVGPYVLQATLTTP